MAGPLLHDGATVNCTHTGRAEPTVPDLRVSVGGKNVVTLATSYLVTGCTLPPNAGGPCVSARWIVGATRVQASGMAVLLTDSTAVCVPTGTGLTVVATQTRVTGQ